MSASSARNQRQDFVEANSANLPAARIQTSTESNSDLEDQGSTRKRVFEALSGSLTQTGRKKKHKKYSSESSFSAISIRNLIHSLHVYRDDVLLPYAQAGRWIPRAYSPFINITSMFWVGIAATIDRNNEPDAENTFMSQL
jgi:hypothetical protein